MPATIPKPRPGETRGADGKPADLQRKIAGREVYRATIEGSVDSVRDKLSSTSGVESVEVLSEHGSACDYRVRGQGGAQLGTLLFTTAKDNGWVLSVLHPEWRTLEDVYLHLTATKQQQVAQAS